MSCPNCFVAISIKSMQAPVLSGGKGGKSAILVGKGGKGAKVVSLGGKGKGGKAASGKAKKAPMSRSARAGLQFPVGRLSRQLVCYPLPFLYY